MLITFGREGIVNSCHRPLEASLFVALHKAIHLTPPVSTIPVLVPKLRTHTKSLKPSVFISFTTHLYHGYIMVFKPHFPISGHKLSRQTKFSESTPSGQPRRCFPRFQDRTGMAWPWGNPGDIGYPWISGDPDVKKPLVGGFGYSNCRNMK